MSYAESCTRMETEFTTIPVEQCVVPIYPFKHFVQESLDIYTRLLNAQAVLSAGGMDFTKVELLKHAIGAYRETYSNCSIISFPSSADKKQWDSLLEEAEYLIYDLRSAMTYAFRDNPEYLAKLVLINQGSSFQDTIQDLNDYAVLGRELRSLLDAIGYDYTNCERAAALSETMGLLYAKVRVDGSETSALLVRRNQAYTYLKKLFDELVAQARFILRANRKAVAELAVQPPKKKSTKSKPVTEPAEPVVAK
jgi:hypothetical protein